MPRDEILEQVTSLTDKIRSMNIPCLRVGPSWGTEGGPFIKNFERVQQLSQHMATTTVSPCMYIDSTELARQGAWPAFDGQHYTVEGCRAYGIALAQQIAQMPEVPAAARRH